MVRAEAAERRRARETQTRTNQPKNTEAAAQRQSNKTKTKTKKSRLLYGCAGARSLFSQYPGIKAHSAPALLDSQSPASSSAADKRRSAQRGVSSSLLPLLSSHLSLPLPSPVRTLLRCGCACCVCSCVRLVRSRVLSLLFPPPPLRHRRSWLPLVLVWASCPTTTTPPHNTTRASSTKMSTSSAGTARLPILFSAIAASISVRWLASANGTRHRVFFSFPLPQRCATRGGGVGWESRSRIGVRCAEEE